MNPLRTFGLAVATATLLLGALTAAAAPVASTASAPIPARRAATAVAAPAAISAAEVKQANLILDDLKAKYRHLDGVTLRFGPTPQDHEAVSYYADGEIVISDRHVVSLEKILAHEIWHIIDYRDNGNLDWGEDLPPMNASAYFSGK